MAQARKARDPVPVGGWGLAEVESGKIPGQGPAEGWGVGRAKAVDKAKEEVASPDVEEIGEAPRSALQRGLTGTFIGRLGSSHILKGGKVTCQVEIEQARQVWAP